MGRANDLLTSTDSNKVVKVSENIQNLSNSPKSAIQLQKTVKKSERDFQQAKGK